MIRFLPILALALISCASPPNADQLGRYSQAKSLYLKGQLQQSSELLVHLVQQNDGFVAARFLSGKIAYLNSDWKAAEGQFSRILELEPGHADARLWRSRTALASGNLELSQADLVWLLEHNAENPQVTLQAAALAEVQGEYQVALEHYRTTVLFRDEVGKALLNTARLYKRSLQNEKALEQARDARQVVGSASYLAAPIDTLISELSASR